MVHDNSERCGGGWGAASLAGSFRPSARRLNRRASGRGSSPRGHTRVPPGTGRCPRARPPLFFLCSSLQGKTTATAVGAVDCVDNRRSRSLSPPWRCGRTRVVTRGQIAAPGENYGGAPFGPQLSRVVPGCIPGCGPSCTRVLHRVIVAWISPDQCFSRPVDNVEAAGSPAQHPPPPGFRPGFEPPPSPFPGPPDGRRGPGSGPPRAPSGPPRRARPGPSGTRVRAVRGPAAPGCGTDPRRPHPGAPRSTAGRTRVPDGSARAAPGCRTPHPGAARADGEQPRLRVGGGAVGGVRCGLAGRCGGPRWPSVRRWGRLRGCGGRAA